MTSFVKDYKHNDTLRESLIRLVQGTFGIDFRTWYDRGYWNERYIPYSLTEGGKVVANVSVNLVDMVVEGERLRTVQLGTVLTHPEYRGKGYSASLMERVIEEYEQQCEFMYLFANDTVLKFYPRFGFKSVEERMFSMPFSMQALASATPLRKLRVDDPDDLALLYEIAKGRAPVSHRLGTVNTEGIFMFYALNVFPEDMYYMEREETVVIARNEGDRLHLYDVVSKDVSRMNLERLLPNFASAGTKEVWFHFTPDEGLPGLSTEPHRGGLFVRSTSAARYPEGLKHPITSIA